MEKQYGEWTVLGPSPTKKYYSRCKCSCGKIADVSNSTLRRKKSTSCGHDSSRKTRERGYKISDAQILNKRFERLVAVKRINATGKAKYLCKCDCGNEVEVFSSMLLNGKTKSCGCLKVEKSRDLMQGIQNKGRESLSKGFVESTALHSFDQRVSKNNSTGIKGVSKRKNGRYRAYINLKGKQIHLGVFDTIEEAKKARLDAEKEYYEPIKEKYDKK